MARNIPGGMNLAIDTTLAMCIQITDRLDNVQGFTEHDLPITRNISDGNGNVIFNPEAAFGRSAIEARSGGRTTSMDLIGFIDRAGITEQKLLSGIYDSGLVRMFLTDWTDTSPTAGIIWIDIGELEETTLQDDKLVVTFKSLLDRYNSIKIGDYYQPDCFHRLGSQPEDIPPPFGKIGCRVQGIQDDLPLWTANTNVLKREDRNARPTGNETSGSPTQFNTVRPITENGRLFETQGGGTTGGSEPSWNTTIGGTTSDGSVTWITRQAVRETVTILSVTDQSNLIVQYSGDAEDNWYRRGRMEFITGANVGISKPIKTQVGLSPSGDGQLITLWLPFPLGIEAGSPEDQAVLIAGCDHKLETCKDKFRNLRNYGGWAIYAPNMDDVFKIPKQAS